MFGSETVRKGTDYDWRVSGLTLVGHGLMELFESDLFRAFLGLGWAECEDKSARGGKRGLTRWDVVFWVDRDALGEFEEVDGLEDVQTLTDGGYADGLEALHVEHAEDIARYVVFCDRVRFTEQCRISGWTHL